MLSNLAHAFFGPLRPGVAATLGGAWVGSLLAAGYLMGPAQRLTPLGGLMIGTASLAVAVAFLGPLLSPSLARLLLRPGEAPKALGFAFGGTVALLFAAVPLYSALSAG